MKQRILCLIVGTVILLACKGWANPLPFIEKVENPTAYSTFHAIAGLPADNPARKEFFAETEKNLGINEEQLNALLVKDPSAIGTWVYNKDRGVTFRSGGLKNGRNHYWRDVKEGEVIAVLHIGDKWRPWYLVACGNPVREETKKDEPKKVAATAVPTTEATGEVPKQLPKKTIRGEYRPCGCFQGPSHMVQSATEVYSGEASHHFGGMYRKTTCISDQDYEGTKQGRNLQ